MDSETLPHRFRESSFRRYEYYITQAVNAFPATICVKPITLGLSPVTFACRCRDAIKSYVDNKWTSTINREKFQQCYHSLVISERSNGDILIGAKDKIAEYAQRANEAAFSTVEPSAVTIHNETITLQTQSEKDLIMLLSHKRLLQPKIFLVGLSDDEADHYQKSYDIAIERHDERTHILI